ncbi:MAG: hypothetical protein KDD34_08300, partial [Bdellovibrionales bacterium]|nr:hypothetical protein [Bdellovibrionales bacterium]
VDMSDSMNKKRDAVAQVAEKITERLGKQCQQYEIGVSNLVYKERVQIGGELVVNYGEPAFITENTKNGVELLKERITAKTYYQENKSIEFMYAAGTSEKTYSSVLLTLPEHLKKSPSGLNNDSLVGVLILSDAAPFFEDLPPQQALSQIQASLHGRPFMASSLGASSLQCLDSPIKPGELEWDQLVHQLTWLEEFSKNSYGYHWNICSDLDMDQSIDRFLNMLLQAAGCLLIV